jgi:hypothetical protein
MKFNFVIYCFYYIHCLYSKAYNFVTLFFCSADGTLLPPMVVYKSGNGVVYQNWCEGGPEGATYAASRSGWFDMSKFNQWFKQASPFMSRYGT